LIFYSRAKSRTASNNLQGLLFLKMASKTAGVKYLIQRPSMGTEPFVNAVVEAEVKQVDHTWGILESVKILNQFSAKSTPEEFKSLPVIHKGYCDTHLHAVWMASQTNKLSLKGIASIDGIFSALTKFSDENPGIFLQAFDWDQDRMEVSVEHFAERFITFCREKNIECVAFRICAHMALISDGLRSEWNVGPDTIIKDAPLERVHQRLFRWSAEESSRLFEQAQEMFLARGITAVSEMSVADDHLQGILDLAKKGKLKIDVQIVLDHEVREEIRRAGPFVEFNTSDIGPLGTPAQVQVRHIKRFLDGSLGARSAWMRAPYDDDETFGDSLYSDENLFDWAEKSLRNGWLLSFHAIGDGALDQIYRLSLHCRDLLKRSLMPEYSPFFKFPSRHRIEHAQVLGDELLNHLQSQQLWSFQLQPYHRIADEGFVIKRLGPTRFYNDGYRFGSISGFSGSSVGLGSDAPIADWNPIDILRSATTHPNPLERVDWLTALWHYTTGARLSLGLDPGKLSSGSTVVITPYGQ
jgi:predicted amidohydrolase YtcJ